MFVKHLYCATLDYKTVQVYLRALELFQMNPHGRNFHRNMRSQDKLT